MKKFFLRFCALFTILFCSAMAFAQDTLSVAQAADHNINTPSDLVSEASVMAIMAVFTGLLAYFSKLFPLLGNITDIKLRAFVLGLTVVLGAIKFRLGFFNTDTLPFLATAAIAILSAFGVTGGAGLLYDIIRWFTGGKLKSLN